MKTIKFRGETPAGEIVYGDLTHHDVNVFVNDKRVIPHTVRQLVFTDSTGKDFYEGDFVIGDDNHEYILYLAAFAGSDYEDFDLETYADKFFD